MKYQREWISGSFIQGTPLPLNQGQIWTAVSRIYICRLVSKKKKRPQAHIPDHLDKWGYSTCIATKHTSCVTAVRATDEWGGFKGYRQLLQWIWSRPRRGHSASAHHLWLSLPLQSHCVKQHLVWNPSHHELPTALTQTDGNPVWTTRERGKKVREKESLFNGNFLKMLRQQLFCVFSTLKDKETLTHFWISMKGNKVQPHTHVAATVYTTLATIKHYYIIHLGEWKTYSYLLWQELLTCSLQPRKLRGGRVH